MGVITYILLSGKAPFEGEDEHQLYQQILAARISFPERQWMYVSCAAKDFILRLLDRNPKKRYQADKIRVHPWITSEHSAELIYKERGENLRMMTAKRRVQKVQYLIEQTIEDIGLDHTM